MAVSALVRAELARHDWKSLACMCGDSAEHVPLLFETVITAETPRDMIGYTLDGHVEGDTNITECTASAVGVIMAALAGELSSSARGALLAAGAGDGGAWPSGWALGDECRATALEGFWVLVGIGLTGSADDADTVADICEYLDPGGEKSIHYQALLRERARRKTKRRAGRWR
ncbi:hypothetical protein ACFYYI_33610 [Streptomyces sp. NPDC002387]|uniref:hypothetical protein n=1 Tax=Streptomyces sp. NPDC002387 TaxID=3364643 RepID=UPI0036808BA3